MWLEVKILVFMLFLKETQGWAAGLWLACRSSIPGAVALFLHQVSDIGSSLIPAVLQRCRASRVGGQTHLVFR